MNITTPILTSATHLAALPGASVTSFLKMIGEGTGLFDDGPDGGLGMVMSGLSGVAWRSRSPSSWPSISAANTAPCAMS
jgi:hypothetical protein